jgi:hypothetical protein
MSSSLRSRIARALIRLGRHRLWRWPLGALQIILGAGSRRVLHLAPAFQIAPVEGESGQWIALGPDPQFVSRDLYLRIPKGWCYLDARLAADRDATAALYLDTGSGFSAAAIELRSDPLEGAHGLVRIPAATRALRFDPLDSPGPFQLGSVVLAQAALPVQVLHAARGLIRRLRPWVRALGRRTRAGLTMIVVGSWRALATVSGTVAVICFQRPTPRHVTIEPDKQLAAIPSEPGRWHSLGSDPRFRLTGGSLPRGWCDFSTAVRCGGGAPEPHLYAELRAGKEPVLASSTWLVDSDRVRGRIYVPLTTKRLWWGPMRRPGEFRQDPSLLLRPLGRLGQLRAAGRGARRSDR